MNRFQWRYSHHVLTFMFTFALITFANGLSPLLAEPETAASILQLKQLSDHEPLEFEPPNDGAPGDRKDAGSRPFCPQSDSPFTALVPVTNLGFTTAQYPTFWLYTLYSSGVIELVLMDENTKNTVYQTQFQVTEGPGIISFKLPDTAPSLEIDKKYRWTFDFLCNAPSDALSVTGVILRKSLTSTLQNQSDTPGKAGGLMNVTASKADVLAGGVSISL